MHNWWSLSNQEWIRAEQQTQCIAAVSARILSSSYSFKLSVQILAISSFTDTYLISKPWVGLLNFFDLTFLHYTFSRRLR